MGTIRFILGRAGTGKTHACLEAISQLTNSCPVGGAPIVFLVPEQATFQAERALAQRCGGGLLRASVTSFQRIARHIRSQIGGVGHHTMLTSTRLAAMRQMTMSLASRLKYWRHSQPAAIAPTLLKTLDELSAAGLAIEELERRAATLASDDAHDRRLADKLHDLILLGRQWRELQFAQLDDPKTAMELYRERLKETHLLDGAQIFIDGFAGFTGQEYAAIAAIAEVAEQVTIALCIDPAELAAPATLSEWMPFASVRKTYERLRRMIAEHRFATAEAVLLSDETPKRFAGTDANPAIAAIERQLAFGTRGETLTHATNVVFMEAARPIDEVRMAAETIRKLVHKYDLRYRQISIVMRDVMAYESLIRDVFDRYGIAFFIDTRRPIGRSPLARLVLGAIRSIVTNLDSAAVMQFAKSGLLAIADDDLAELENYVLERGVSGDRWRSEWSRRSRLAQREDEESQDESQRSLESARKAIVGPLEQLRHALGVREDGAVANRTWRVDALIDAVVTLLNDLDVRKRLSTLCERYSAAHDDVAVQVTRQVWKTFREMLSQLRVTLAGQELTLAGFAQILADGFAEQSIGVVPSCVDQVLIGSIERSRQPEIAATLILGFNEGQFPSAAHSDVILDDADRERLAWPDLTRLDDMEEHASREQYLMYIAMTRADRFLYVSWSQASSEGQTLFASRFVRRLQSIVGVQTTLAKTATCVADDSELSAKIVGAMALNGLADREAYWATLTRAIVASDAASAMLRRYLSLYRREGRAAFLSAESAAWALGEAISISRIQTYHLCPFSFFCKHALRLQPRKVFRMEQTDLGTFAHDVIRDAWESACRSQWRVTMVDVRDIDAVFDAAVGRQLKKHDDTVLTRAARNKYVLDVLVRQLRLSFRSQVSAAQAAVMEPWRFESAFSLPMRVADREVRFEGRIDRVDRAEVDDAVWLSVIDYKLHAKRDDLSLWNAGANLQLTAYLYAMTTLESRRCTKHTVVPMMATYVPLMMEAYRPTDDAAAIEDVAPAFRAQGWVDTKRCGAVYRGMDAKAWPVKLPRTAVVDSEILARAIAQTEARLLEAMAGIAEGRIAATPVRVGVKNRACSLCDFRSVCRFDAFCDRFRNVPTYRYTQPMTWIGGR